jgi:hypothetical protein
MVKKTSEGSNVAYALSLSESAQSGTGKGFGSGGRSHSVSEQHSHGEQINHSYEPLERPVVYERELSGLPSPREEAGRGLVVRAYMVVQEHGWFEQASFMERYSIAENPATVVLEPFDNRAFEKEAGWTKRDYKRLNLDAGASDRREERNEKPERSRKTPFEQMLDPDEVAPGAPQDEPEPDAPDEHWGVWFDEGDGEGFVGINGN